MPCADGWAVPVTGGGGWKTNTVVWLCAMPVTVCNQEVSYTILPYDPKFSGNKMKYSLLECVMMLASRVCPSRRSMAWYMHGHNITNNKRLCAFFTHASPSMTRGHAWMNAGPRPSFIPLLSCATRCLGPMCVLWMRRRIVLEYDI